jgi:hypothetical protein
MILHYETLLMLASTAFYIQSTSWDRNAHAFRDL